METIETIETTIETVGSTAPPYRVHPKHGICLDAGCGTGPKRPAAGFSVYCDVIPVRGGVLYPTPYFNAPLEDMSCFADKQFDWVRCNHAIEHTINPAKACDELMRVGKAGIISFPGTLAEMCYGRRDHTHYVFVDRGRLVFVPKFHASLGIPQRRARGALNVDFVWHGKFKYVLLKIPGE